MYYVNTFTTDWMWSEGEDLIFFSNVQSFGTGNTITTLNIIKDRIWGKTEFTSISLRSTIYDVYIWVVLNKNHHNYGFTDNWQINYHDYQDDIQLYRHVRSHAILRVMQSIYPVNNQVVKQLYAVIYLNF